MGIDIRIFQKDAYIHSGINLSRVLNVNVIGSFPHQRKTVTVENCYTTETSVLTEKELADFTYLERTECSDDTSPSSAAA